MVCTWGFSTNTIFVLHSSVLTDWEFSKLRIHLIPEQILILVPLCLLWKRCWFWILTARELQQNTTILIGNRHSKRNERSRKLFGQKHKFMVKYIFTQPNLVEFFNNLPAGIMLYEDSVAVFKNAPDANFYVIGGVDENELILANVLQTFYDAVSVLLRFVIGKESSIFRSCFLSKPIIADIKLRKGLSLKIWILSSWLWMKLSMAG